MEMTRAAFAPLIKFTIHTSDFTDLVDELDIVEADLFDETPEAKLTKRIAYLQENRAEAFAKIEA